MVDNSQYYYSERKFKQLEEPFSFSFFYEKVNKYSQLYCSKTFWYFWFYKGVHF